MTSVDTPEASRDELRVGSDRLSFKLTSEQTGGEVAVFDVTIPPGGGPAMLHRHDPFELYRVRSGELAIYLEDRDGAVRRRVARPGTFVPIGGGLEHTVRNESNEEAEAIVVFSPGEPMERFARAAHDLSRDGTPGHDEVLAVAAAHGIEITRPIEEGVRSCIRASGDAGAGGCSNARPDPGAAYLTIARFSGAADRLLEEYRKYSDVMSAVGRDHGLILHAGAKTDSGFLVVNLWPSRENSEAAARDPRRLGVIERAEIGPEQIHREHHQVADFLVFD
jgi:mannose-6-phosphate isomerase-like protein (cupin superfamily)